MTDKHSDDIAYFSIEENYIRIPWRDYRFSNRSIFLMSVGLAVLVAICAMSEDHGSLTVLGCALGTFVFSMLMLRWHRYWNSKGPLTTPFIISNAGIHAPTLFYKALIPWQDISRIEMVWSMIGPNISPIENNLMIYRHGQPTKRMFIPTLTWEERQVLDTILKNIAAKEGFALSLP